VKRTRLNLERRGRGGEWEASREEVFEKGERSDSVANNGGSISIHMQKRYKTTCDSEEPMTKRPFQIINIFTKFFLRYQSPSFVC